MSIEQKISIIDSALKCIRLAILGKGQTPSGDITTYADAISNISGGGGEPVLQDKTLAVGSTTPTETVLEPDSGYDGLSSATLNMSFISNKLSTIIGSGTIPIPEPLLESITVTQNGTYSANSGYDGLSTVKVQIPEGFGSGIPRQVSSQGVYEAPTSSFVFTLPSNAVDLGKNALFNAFTGSSITSADLSSLTKITGQGSLANAFQDCPYFSSINLSNLEKVEINIGDSYDPEGASGMENMCAECSSLTTLSLPSLTSIKGNMSNLCHYCTALTSVNLSSLEEIISESGYDEYDDVYYSYNGTLQYAFQGCTNLLSIDLSSLSDIGDRALFGICYGCSSLRGIDLSLITTISEYGMYAAFHSCSNLLSMDLSSVQSVTGYYSLYSAFRGCSKLASANLSSLTTASGQRSMEGVFYGCKALTSLTLPNLATVTGTNALKEAFRECTGLTSMTFPALTTLSGSGSMNSAFRGCTNLTSISFPSLTSTAFGSYTNHFNSMLTGVTGCTVHFPSNLQSVIGSWTDVTNGFGGTSTTVLFDLPATS